MRTTEMRNSIVREDDYRIIGEWERAGNEDNRTNVSTPSNDDDDDDDNIESTSNK